VWNREYEIEAVPKMSKMAKEDNTHVRSGRREIEEGASYKLETRARIKPKQSAIQTTRSVRGHTLKYAGAS
jgi:hypothetical protein